MTTLAHAPARVLTIALLTALAACSGSGPGVLASADRTALVAADTIEAQPGALEPRVAALNAFNGDRAPLTLRMQNHTVEGVTVISYLSASKGRALLEIDERADGGGIRSYTLDALVLVELLPSRWENNVELEKERWVRVDPRSAQPRAGVYYLVHPRCLTGSCTEVF